MCPLLLGILGSRMRLRPLVAGKKSKIRKTFNVLEIPRRTPSHGISSASLINDCRAGSRETASHPPLARIWLSSRLSHAGTDRVGEGAKSRTGLLVRLSGLLQGALERRRLRSMLDPDPDRQCLELRSLSEVLRRRCCDGSALPSPFFAGRGREWGATGMANKFRIELPDLAAFAALHEASSPCQGRGLHPQFRLNLLARAP
jgi:hypothetical protein